MGYCDPKAIRNGKAWADVVNKTPLPPHPQTVLLARAWFKKINDLLPKPKPRG
jgi:hypothetical protein